MRLKIHHTVAARRDFEEIWQFIAADNERAADNLLRQIMAKIALVAEKPEIGRQRMEFGNIPQPARRAIRDLLPRRGRNAARRTCPAYRNLTPEMLSD